MFLVERFEAGVLRGEAAFGGDVDEEQDFAAVLGEGVGLVLRWRGEGFSCG